MNTLPIATISLIVFVAACLICIILANSDPYVAPKKPDWSSISVEGDIFTMNGGMGRLQKQKSLIGHLNLRMQQEK